MEEINYMAEIQKMNNTKGGRTASHNPGAANHSTSPTTCRGTAHITRPRQKCQSQFAKQKESASYLNKQPKSFMGSSTWVNGNACK